MASITPTIQIQLTLTLAKAPLMIPSIHLLQYQPVHVQHLILNSTS